MLKAGFSQASITPPVGVELSGWAFGPSACVLEELQAQAVALESGDTRAVIITADIIGFSRQVVENVRTQLERGTGIPASHIIFSASHTHSGPGVARLRHWGEPDPDYIARLEDQLVDLGHRALLEQNPVTVAGGVGRVENCSVNRRGVKGLLDPAVPVIRFDNTAGETQAVIWNFGCHPVALHSYRNVISPDYVGYARDEIRRLLGPHVIVMFTLGANGDTNPDGFVFGNPQISNARRVGRTLAAEVARAAKGLKPADAELKFAYKHYALPYEPLPSAEKLAKIRNDALAAAENAHTAGRGRCETAHHKILVEWADDALAELKAGERLEGNFEMQAIRLGDIGIVTDQFETYSATALGVKDAFAGTGKTIIMAGQCNAAAGYLPTADAYEIDDYTGPTGHAPKVYGVHAFDRKAEPICRQNMIDLLKQVFKDKQ